MSYDEIGDTEIPDASGIRVDLVRVPHHGQGHPSWEIPLGGGEVKIPADELPHEKDGYIVIEVRPQVEMPTGHWRDYDDLERLCIMADKQGGYMCVGDAIEIGDEILVGRDVVNFLTHALRRAHKEVADLEGKPNYEGYRNKQVRADAIQEVRDIVEKHFDEVKREAMI